MASAINNQNLASQLELVQILVKELPKDPSIIGEIDKKISELLKSHPLPSLQKVKKRIETIKAKIQTGEAQDFPIQSVGLHNLIRRVVEIPPRSAMELEINRKLKDPLIKNNPIGLRELILENPNCVDDRSANGLRWMQIACAMGRSEIVSLMIQAGVEIDLPLRDTGSAIFTVCRGICMYGKEEGVENYQNTLKHLLVTGINPNYRDLDSGEREYFLESVFETPNLNLDNLEFLLPQLVDAGMDLTIHVRTTLQISLPLEVGIHEVWTTIPSTNKIGTPLDVAANLLGHERLVRQLIYNGAQRAREKEETPNAQNFDKYEAIYKKVSLCHPESTFATLRQVPGVEAIPYDLLKLIDAYRKPTVAAIREACYIEEASSIEETN